MSRSRRKNPIWREIGRHGSNKEARTIANRMWRREMKALLDNIPFDLDEDDRDMPVTRSPRASNIHKKKAPPYCFYEWKYLYPKNYLMKEIESDKKRIINGGMPPYKNFLDDKEVKEYIKEWKKYYLNK